MDTSHIKSAIESCGGKAVLARQINVSPQVVWQWADGRRPVPAHHCMAIEEATEGKVTRYDLRPDVFGPAPTKPRKRAA